VIGTDDVLCGPSDVAAAVAAESSRRAFGEGLSECLALQLLEAGHESGRKLLRQFRGSTRGHIRPEENRESEKLGKSPMRLRL
jgi:hypothetical protein